MNAGAGNCCAAPKGEVGVPTGGPNSAEGLPNDLEGVPGRLGEKAKWVGRLDASPKAGVEGFGCVEPNAKAWVVELGVCAPNVKGLLSFVVIDGAVTL